MIEENTLFLDKLKISLVLLIKESTLTQIYSNLIKKIKNGLLDRNSVLNSEDYWASWNFVHELFCFLKYNKIEELKNSKKQGDDFKKDLIILNSTITNYEKLDYNPTFEDLQICYDIMIKVMSRSGYHDDKLMKQEFDETPQYIGTGD